MFFKKWFTKPKSLSKISEATARLKLLDTFNFTLVYTSDMSILAVSSHCKTITVYIELLKTIMEFFSKEEVISQYLLPREIYTISVSEFFLDKKGNYLDPQKTVNEFIELSAGFLELYQQNEQGEQTNFNTEKNLLLTQYIVSNLLSIFDSTLFAL